MNTHSLASGLNVRGPYEYAAFSPEPENPIRLTNEPSERKKKFPNLEFFRLREPVTKAQVSKWLLRNSPYSSPDWPEVMDRFRNEFAENESILAEEIDVDPDTLPEGAAKQILINAYERNHKARQLCIAHYGAICTVCAFDFAAEYGPEGKGYIHVHHLTPLAKIGKEYQVDPITDLRPVCPNCHAVIHLGRATRPIEEVQAMRRKAAQR